MRSRHRRGRGARASEGQDDEQEALAAELSRRADVKSMQLCREVERTLASVLAGELGDGSLGGLVVVAVEPAPDASRLMVTLAAPDGVDGAALLERLRGLVGWLRAEIAAAVQRKRVPELAFCLIEAAWEPADRTAPAKAAPEDIT